MTMMNTAVTGMLAQNNWLSTIAQNVANSSTTGYKDAETDFASLVDQAGSSSAYPGIGVSTSSLTLAAQQGAIAATATPTDLAVNGAGFFVVSNAAGDTFLTRNGSFVPDASGNLVNAAGYYLMGASAQNGATGLTSALQKVNIDGASPLDTPSTAATLSLNLPASASIVAAAATPAGGGATTTDKTSLVAYDNGGNPLTLDVYATKLADNVSGQPTWEVDVYNAANASAGGGFPYSAPALASQTVSFDPTTGQATGAAALSLAIPNGQTMSLDLGGSTQLASAFAISAATANGGQTTFSGVSIGAYGGLSFLYANGTQTSGYVIPLANVASPDSLTAVDGTVFSTNAKSGQMLLGAPGSSGLGTLQSSSLEGSAVDTATELTSMIQAQSGYGFNSQVFQTSSDVIKDLNQWAV
jgi:flagellar hook protein FlgE